MSANNDTFTDIDTVPHVNTFHETPVDLPGYDEWLARHEMTEAEIDAACAAEAARQRAEIPTLKPITAMVRQLDPAAWKRASVPMFGKAVRNAS